MKKIAAITLTLNLFITIYSSEKKSESNSENLNKDQTELNTSFINAIKHGFLNLAKKRLSEGAKIDAFWDEEKKKAIDYVNNKLLEYQLIGCTDENAKKNYQEIYQFLIDQHLIDAAKRGIEFWVEKYLKKGARLNATNNNGETALACAIQNANERIIERLTKAQKELNDLLLQATHLGDLVLIKKYLSDGAYINSSMPSGKTVLDLALTYKDVHIVHYLLNNNAKYTSEYLYNQFFYNLVLDSNTKIELFLKEWQKYFDQNFLNNLLHYAIKVRKVAIRTDSLNEKTEKWIEHNLEIISKLVKYGADIYSPSNDIYSNSALQTAIICERPGVFYMLLRNGADLFYKTNAIFNLALLKSPALLATYNYYLKQRNQKNDLLTTTNLVIEYLG